MRTHHISLSSTRTSTILHQAQRCHGVRLCHQLVVAARASTSNTVAGGRLEYTIFAAAGSGFRDPIVLFTTLIGVDVHPRSVTSSYQRRVGG